VARYGGDEFRILLPHTDAAEARIAADRLRGVVEQHAFQRRKRYTVNVGVATYPADASDPGTLNVRAQTALFEAKQVPQAAGPNGDGHEAAVN
jgi:diguanylate cyclase (GGDEF)-like protein